MKSFPLPHCQVACRVKCHSPSSFSFLGVKISQVSLLTWAIHVTRELTFTLAYLGHGSLKTVGVLG